MKTINTKKFLDYFDKIYLITLANRQDRKESIIKQFQTIGIYNDLINSGKFEVVETVRLPITQNALDAMATSGDISFRYSSEKQEVGQFMCASEHYRIIKRSYIHNLERILILEDDVCFLKEFKYILKALENAPDDFNILHLEGFYWPGNEEDQERYTTLLTPNIEEARWISSEEGFRLWCTSALIYSREGMRKYCEEQERLFQSPDHPTFWMDNSYSYSYPLIMQEKKSVFTSDIVYYSQDIEDVNIYLKYYDYNNYYHFYKKYE